MKTARSVLATAILLIAAAFDATGQPLQHVQFSGRYTAASALHDGVTSAAGSGLGIQLHVPFLNGIGANVKLGYDRLAVRQDDMINRWDWFYWRQIYAFQVQTLQNQFIPVNGDSVQEYSAVIRPVQHAVLLSASVMPTVNFTAGNLNVELGAGASGIRFTRVMYLDETWTKRFPQIDYEYTYSFRNYAEDKVGYLMSLDAAVQFNYRLTRLFTLAAGGHYRSVMTHHDDFPINNLWSGQIGIAVNY